LLQILRRVSCRLEPLEPLLGCSARPSPLRGWFETFDDRDDVSLVLKTFPNPHNDVAAQLAANRQAQDQHKTLSEQLAKCREENGLLQEIHVDRPFFDLIFKRL
jgi:hypothetical protein